MKKLLLPLVGALLALTHAAGAERTPQIIPIHTDRASLVLCVEGDGTVLLRHFGGRIDDVAPMAAYSTHRRTDHGAGEEIYPAAGGRNFRLPALRATHADGDVNTELRYVSHETLPSDDAGVVRTVVRLADPMRPLEVELLFTAYLRENVIATRSRITNREQGPVTLHAYYSSALSLHGYGSYLLTQLRGGWADEAQIEHLPLGHGTHSISTRKLVRTTHTENPAFMLSLDTDRFDEEHGEVIAGALAWSGNYRIDFSVDEYDILTLLAGANPDGAAYTLDAGQTLTTPEMVYTFSDCGAGGASRNLHDWARRYGIRDGHRGHVPTLLNSWERAYFDFGEETLRGMIDDAAAMGLEMFVLDDGWFGNKYPRNHDRAGLGDWEVNSAKLPGGIDRIASYAHERGLKFGIWIEPEMVNPRSELAERHPDWVVRAPGREAPLIRHQWLLDLSNPEVQDFVFGVFDRTMSLSKKIDYIKWDANRHAESIGSAYLPADRQSNFWVDYTRGLYRVMERIRAKYPDVLIQACSSGGGRVEYGALKYFDEVWTSDDTEALSRARIQYGTSLFYPAAVMGAHVSASPNHQSGNVIPLKFRFDMAAAGRLGMELQPRQMSDEERAYARRAIATYKEFRDLVEEGDLYRIGSPYDPSGTFGTLYVSKDKRRAVFMAYCIRYRGHTPVPQFRLRGLDDAARYAVRELNVDGPRCWFDGETLTGAYLRNEGINPPLQRLYDSAVYLLEAE